MDSFKQRKINRLKNGKYVLIKLLGGRKKDFPLFGNPGMMCQKIKLNQKAREAANCGIIKGNCCTC